MKKAISLILPSILILAFIFLDNMNPESKNIIVGIYLIFPIVFIIQGVIYSSLKSDVLIGFILSSLAIIIPTSILYNMGSLIGPVIIYIILGLTSYYVKRKVKITWS